MGDLFGIPSDPEKFPDGYILDLDNQESEVLRSQIATLEQGKGWHELDDGQPTLVFQLLAQAFSKRAIKKGMPNNQAK